MIIIAGKDKPLGVWQSGYAKYQLNDFSSPATVTWTSSGKSVTRTVDVWRVLGLAIAFINNKVKRHDPCNAYFRKLRRGKSLREVVESEDVYLHRIEPLAGFTEDDLPRGISVGAHVGLPLYVLADSNLGVVTASLIHELAHVAGAPRYKEDPTSHLAEEALKYCLFPSQYDPSAVGALERFRQLADKRPV